MIGACLGYFILLFLFCFGLPNWLCLGLFTMYVYVCPYLYMPSINILSVFMSMIFTLFNVLTRSMEELQLDGVDDVRVLQVSFCVFLAMDVSF